MSRHRLPDEPDSAPAPAAGDRTAVLEDTPPVERRAPAARANRHRAAAPARQRHRLEHRPAHAGNGAASPSIAGRAHKRRAGARRAGLVGRRRSMVVLLAVAVGLIALPTAGSAAVDGCRWQEAAHELYLSLDGQDGHRASTLRDALEKAGVGPDLPEECAKPADAGTQEAAAPTGDDSDEAQQPETAAPAPTTAPAPAPKPKPKPAAPAKPAPAAPAPATTGAGTTAAAAFGWGTPVKSDDFTTGLSGWNVYDGPGHAGNGRRTPDAASVASGLLTITGDSQGDTAGMAWGKGQKYGRWEGRVKAPASDPSYNALLLLWPDAENFPVGGEVDFMEMSDHTRQTTETFLHYGSSNSQKSGKVAIDATQWHNWAVEWTPDHITTFVDGKQWWTTKDTGILPPGPMHLCIQLDWFPKGGSAKQSQMQVDWVKQYAL
jgi:hypothetical protein